MSDSNSQNIKAAMSTHEVAEAVLAFTSSSPIKEGNNNIVNNNSNNNNNGFEKVEDDDNVSLVLPPPPQQQEQQQQQQQQEKEKIEEDSNLAIVLLDEANLAYAQKKHEKAVLNYSQVAECYSLKYGTLHPLYADVVFRYGRALLAQAIESSGVFGNLSNANHNNNISSSSSSNGKLEKDLLSTSKAEVSSSSNFDHQSTKMKTTCTTVNNLQEDNCGNSSNSVVGELIKSSFEKQANGTLLLENSVKKEGEEEEESDSDYQSDEEDDLGDDDEEGGEAEDLDIAFESLDVARVLHEMMLRGEIEAFVQYDDEFDRGQPSSSEQEIKDIPMAIKTRLAEIHSYLGDVCLELENFEQATIDFSASLQHKIDLLTPIDRSLAETHYKLALSYEYGGELLEKAVEHLQSARKVLTDRLKSIEIIKPLDLELKELGELIPDLDLKIEDIVNQIDVKVSTAVGLVSLDQINSTNLLNTTEIQDVTSLIKRKPLPPPVCSTVSSTNDRKRDHIEENEEDNKIKRQKEN